MTMSLTMYYTCTSPPTLQKLKIVIISTLYTLIASGVEYESQLHSQDEVIYQLKQKVDSLIEERDNAIFELKSATELLRGQFKYYPEPIKEEGTDQHYT